MTRSATSYPRRAVRAGAAPALITAGIGVGATGIAGERIEAETEPVTTGVAQAVGLDPQLGPAVVVLLALLVMVLAFVVPGLFEDAH